MKRVMLDYFRRWWWVLALVGVFEFRFGRFIADRPEDNFEFWGMMLAMWPGAILLSYDLRRGVVRAIAPLPLTARQIGRGWWIATVPFPAIALAVLLFAGAGTFSYVHPTKVFPAGRLAWASIYNLMWLGTGFIAIFGAMRRSSRNSRHSASTALFSLLSTIMFIPGMMFFQDASKHPLKCALLLGIGGLLTVVSWFWAEQFNLGGAGPFNADRAGIRLTSLPSTAPSTPHRPPKGYGGMRFLIGTSFVRIFLLVTAMIALMALVQQWQGQAMPPHMAITMFAGMGSFMSCGLIIVLQFLPVLRQLRFLRTLPTSATRLAAVLLSIVILPLIALGALVAIGAGLAFGASAALTVLNSYTFILAPASLCVFFAVWRGDSMQAYALLLVTMFGLQQVQLRLQTFLHYLELPFSLCGSMVAICVLLAFLLTRRALRRSSHTYRVQANPFGNIALGMGQ
ncbi:MAG: hypothetical protein WCK27_00330 [Verrucomicrobiota bacterium]